jgi:RNase adaptor protein for sRNA GlmZ degradation
MQLSTKSNARSVKSTLIGMNGYFCTDNIPAMMILYMIQCCEVASYETQTLTYATQEPVESSLSIEVLRLLIQQYLG